MKVWLMYPDRDWRPSSSPAPHEANLIQDLELDVLFEVMAAGDKFMLQAARQAVLAGLGDPEVIRYRQAILADCLKNPHVVRELYGIPLEAIQNKRRQWLSIFGHYPAGVLSSAVSLLEMFVSLLKKLRRLADEHADQFESAGFTRLWTMLQEELSDDYFAEVESHLKALRFRGGVWVSAELGNANEGAHYILRRAKSANGSWLKRLLTRQAPAYSYTLHPRDDHGARALGELRDRGLNLVANAVAQSADHIDNFLNALRLELAFYLGGLNLAERLAQLGEPIAFPEPAPAGLRRLAFTGLYDISLALIKKQKVVGNAVVADGKDLLIVTGANQGGKSTFLRSLGQAQVLMQCGLFVPAQAFAASLGAGLFTHFKREEDAAMQSGKLDEELGRMSALVDIVRPDGIILFNESFAATNEREGSEIARQIVSALLARRVRVFFVTHLYELARSLYDEGRADAIFLRAERQPDGTRTFKMCEGEPLQTSYGADVYRQVFRTNHPDTPPLSS